MEQGPSSEAKCLSPCQKKLPVFLTNAQQLVLDPITRQTICQSLSIAIPYFLWVRTSGSPKLLGSPPPPPKKHPGFSKTRNFQFQGVKAKAVPHHNVSAKKINSDQRK